MKSYKDLKESLSHDYVLQHLADKDINAHIKNGKVVVHPDDAAETRRHLKKIGHDHLRVTTKGADQVAESAPVAPAPGDKWKSHAVMVNKQSGKRVTISRDSVKNYPEHEGWKEVSPGQKLRKEEVEELDEIKLATVGKIIKHSPKIASAAIGAAVAAHSVDVPKQPVKASYSEFTKKIQKEEVELDEVLDPSMGAGEYVKDFQKSDAPQFKGKSQEKRRIMGIAAYMAAKREKNK